ncbi:MAG: flagellar basal body P-ring formation chaperone FlgA [Nitrospirota bacterium]|nr:flagellar basal body P-ring formation chaperone FlgA [Nitrospirota bacterium]
MKKIFLIGLLFVGGVGWPNDGTLWAVKARADRAGEQSVTARKFEEAIVVAITEQFGRRNHHVSFQVLFPQKPLSVPGGELSLEVEQLSGGARMGRRAFRVRLFIQGQFFKMVNVVGELKAQATVTTPTRWIKPKEVVMADDVMEMTVDLPSLMHDFVLEDGEVIGKQVLRPLPPRQPIRKVMLDDPPLVHKGDRVTIEVRQGGLLVQTVGFAKAAGKSGEAIPVQNQSSGREVIGRIMGSGLVEVGF